MLADVLTRELLYRHVQFVAHIAPKLTQHLVIELVLLACREQLVSGLKAFRSHLVGTLAALAYDVGVLHSLLVEDNHKCYKHDERHNQP